MANPGRCALVPFLQAIAALNFVYLGPVESIENGIVHLEVAPKIGRVVSFRRSEGPEWLQVEDRPPNPGWNWNPWGGDRVWPTAQFLLPQIYKNRGFDPVIDGQPWEVITKTDSSIELRSGVSPELGIRILRRIELPPGESATIHSFKIESRSPRRFPVHIWTVTGVRQPEKFFVETDPLIPHEGFKSFRWWREIAAEPPRAKAWDKGRILEFDAGTRMKVGTYGRRIAALRGREMFLQTISYHPKGLYLEASNLQAYADRENNTYEMETLSPTWMPGRGGSFRWKVRWDLIGLPERSAQGKSRVAINQILERMTAGPP